MFTLDQAKLTPCEKKHRLRSPVPTKRSGTHRYGNSGAIGVRSLTEKWSFPPVSISDFDVVIPAQAAFIQVHCGEVQNNLENAKILQSGGMVGAWTPWQTQKIRQFTGGSRLVGEGVGG